MEWKGCLYHSDWPEDYENNLNYAYDDNHMRTFNVLKMVKRFLQRLKQILYFSCASDSRSGWWNRFTLNLREFRKENLKHYTADIT